MHAYHSVLWRISPADKADDATNGRRHSAERTLDQRPASFMIRLTQVQRQRTGCPIAHRAQRLQFRNDAHRQTMPTTAIRESDAAAVGTWSSELCFIHPGHAFGIFFKTAATCTTVIVKEPVHSHVLNVINAARLNKPRFRV